MAVTQTSHSGNTTSDTAPNAPQAQVSAPDYSTVESAPGRLGFKSLLAQFSAGAGVTPEIEKYLTAVKDAVVKNIKNVEMISLPEPTATHAFITRTPGGERYAFVLIFTDVIGTRPAPNQPMSVYITSAFDALRAQVPNAHMLNAVLVTNNDLNRSRQMAQDIVGAFLPQVDPTISSASVHALAQAGEFVISLNLADAQTFENLHSPHEVRPAANLGFTIALRGNRNRNAYGQEAPDTSLPFMAVTAMVEINGPQADPVTNTMRYIPMVRITSITSEFPVLGATFLGLAIAADYFVAKRLWKKVFSNFGKGAPNLGNLFPNPDPKKTGEMYFVTSQTELDTLVNQQFVSPMLCLDVQEGHSRLTGLTAFTDPDAGRVNILKTASTFFGTEAPHNLTVSGLIATLFEGYYGDSNGRQLDSRGITYLEQAAKHGVLAPNVAFGLLNYDLNPVKRAELVAQQTQGFVPAYATYVVAISSHFMNWVASAVKNSGVRIADPVGYGGVAQIPVAMGDYTNYSNFTGVAMSIGAGGYYGPRNGLYS